MIVKLHLCTEISHDASVKILKSLETSRLVSLETKSRDVLSRAHTYSLQILPSISLSISLQILLSISLHILVCNSHISQSCWTAVSRWQPYLANSSHGFGGEYGGNAQFLTLLFSDLYSCYQPYLTDSHISLFNRHISLIGISYWQQSQFQWWVAQSWR